MNGSTGALIWSAPVAPGWSITGYQVRTGTSTSTVSGATESFDPDSTRYCTPDIVYPVTTAATVAGTATSVESEPATVTATDPVDCTFPSRITEVTALCARAAVRNRGPGAGAGAASRTSVLPPTGGGAGRNPRRSSLRLTTVTVTASAVAAPGDQSPGVAAVAQTRVIVKNRSRGSANLGALGLVLVKTATGRDHVQIVDQLGQVGRRDQFAPARVPVGGECDGIGADILAVGCEGPSDHSDGDGSVAPDARA